MELLERDRTITVVVKLCSQLLPSFCSIILTARRLTKVCKILLLVMVRNTTREGVPFEVVHTLVTSLERGCFRGRGGNEINLNYLRDQTKLNSKRMLPIINVFKWTEILLSRSLISLACSLPPSRPARGHVDTHLHESYRQRAVKVIHSDESYIVMSHT